MIKHYQIPVLVLALVVLIPADCAPKRKRNARNQFAVLSVPHPAAQPQALHGLNKIKNLQNQSRKTSCSPPLPFILLFSLLRAVRTHINIYPTRRCKSTVHIVARVIRECALLKCFLFIFQVHLFLYFLLLSMSPALIPTLVAPRTFTKCNLRQTLHRSGSKGINKPSTSAAVPLRLCPCYTGTVCSATMT